MIIDWTFCIEGLALETIISMRMVFDDFDEADDFNRELVDLYLRHARQTMPKYEYETPWC